MGFEYLVAEEYRLPMLNAVKVPEGIDERVVQQKLLHDYNIEVGGGLGKFAVELWRIGLMGESCTTDHIDKLISALKDII